MSVNRSTSSPMFYIASLLPRLNNRRVGHPTDSIVGKRSLGLLVNSHPLTSSRNNSDIGLRVLGVLGRGCDVIRTSFLSTRLRVIPTFTTGSINLSHDVINTCNRSSQMYTCPTVATVLRYNAPTFATIAVLTSGRRANSRKGANVGSTFLQCFVSSLTTTFNTRNHRMLTGSVYLSTSMGTTLSPVCPSIVIHSGTTRVGCNIYVAGCANTHNGSNADSTSTRFVNHIHHLLSSTSIL